jgi:hypothetical protein
VKEGGKREDGEKERERENKQRYTFSQCMSFVSFSTEIYVHLLHYVICLPILLGCGVLHPSQW